MPEGAKITQHMPMTAQVGQMNTASVMIGQIGWKKIAIRLVVIVTVQVCIVGTLHNVFKVVHGLFFQI